MVESKPEQGKDGLHGRSSSLGGRLFDMFCVILKIICSQCGCYFALFAFDRKRRIIISLS